VGVAKIHLTAPNCTLNFKTFIPDNIPDPDQGAMLKGRRGDGNEMGKWKAWKN